MRAALATALGLLIALGAGGDSASARLADAEAIESVKRCQAQTKRLNTFKRKLAARKRAFFRSHRSRKARRAFVKKQAKKLKALRRARSRCLAPAGGGPVQPAPAAPPGAPAPPPATPDTSPPELSIDSPGAGAWFDAPVARLRGKAGDAGSGVAAVTCGGKGAALAGGGFSCEVPLKSGANAIAVSARDAAGNVTAKNLVVNHAPGGLAGEAGAPAAGVVKAVDTEPRHAESEVSVTPEGRRVARTEIALHLEAEATVEQVNAALRSVGGRIVGAVAASPQLAVGIPDPGSLAALETLLAGLRTRPGVERAGLAEMPAADELPSFATPPSVAEAGQLSHLLAMRMPAAWNARRAIDLTQRPTLIVADMFGNGPLSTQVDAIYNNAELIARGAGNEHGYHVVGIAASSFASNGTAAGNVTGVFPATTLLHVIDAIDITTQMTGLRIINEARARAGRVVVNTSLGFLTPPPDAEAQEAGSDWVQLVRGTAGLENRMLHATSAGNAAAAAAGNSRWSAAAVRTDLTDAADEPTPALRNTLAVENIKDTGTPAYEPGCLAISSNRGGTIAAVGEDVFSHRFGALAGDKSGTSMASPEVAGLATFLWSIAPDLTGPQLRNLIVATARPPLPNDPGSCGTDVPSAPRLDAYTAALSLDQAAAITPATAPVRMAIADRDGDGTFDEEDLEAFAAAARPDAGARDWSRSDLNGDGFTGGAATAPLDLDPTGGQRGGAPQLETVEASIEGIAVEFDEHLVTDLDALCFLAYSGLYTGSVDQRAVLLDPRRNCRAVGAFTNGKLVVTGRGTRTAGTLFGPERLWFLNPPGEPAPFTPEGVAPGRAAWSPDGTRIAFPRRATGTPSGIWTVGAGGENPTHVAGTTENDLDPTWSPDGQRIAFVRRQSPSEGIFIVDADGGVPAIIPGTAGFQDPSWSPDGRKIAAARIGATADIVAFTPDGTGLVNLSEDAPAGDIAPDWSPDGSRIVFASGRPVSGDTDRMRLWIMDADGTDVTQFTAVFANNTSGTKVEDFNPSWSPDGQKIAFTRTHQNGSRIVMTKDVAGGGLAQPVTPVPTATTDATFADPDWQPVPAAP